MLHVFHVDVAKVDLNVAYVAMAIYVYCKRLSKCFSYFRRMLHVFYLGVALMLFYPDVAYDFTHMLHMFCNGYTRISLVFQMYVASVSTVLDICCKCFF
jgi:hypothetical protein